jgi:hypothetical protein
VTDIASSYQNLGRSCTEFSEGVALIDITIVWYFFISHVSRSARLLLATGLISWAVIFTNSHPGPPDRKWQLKVQVPYQIKIWYKLCDIYWFKISWFVNIILQAEWNATVGMNLGISDAIPIQHNSTVCSNDIRKLILLGEEERTCSWDGTYI